jgi:hypothetical protein
LALLSPGAAARLRLCGAAAAGAAFSAPLASVVAPDVAPVVAPVLAGLPSVLAGFSALAGLLSVLAGAVSLLAGAGVSVPAGAGVPAAGATDVLREGWGAFSRSSFSFSVRFSSAFFSADRCTASFCRRFESCWLEKCASPSEVTRKTKAVIDVSRVRKFPAPDEPNTVWLPPPPPPNAIPMPPPLPACRRTTRIKNRQTTT